MDRRRQNADEARKFPPHLGGRPQATIRVDSAEPTYGMHDVTARTPLLGFIHFEKIYRKAKPDPLLSCALTANASKMLLALYCGAGDATGGAMTDDASISSLNSAVRCRSLDEVGATSWFTQFGRHEPLWADAREITRRS